MVIVYIRCTRVNNCPFTVKIAACEQVLREAEEEEQRLSRAVPADPVPVVAPVSPTAPACVDVLNVAFADDPEASMALEVLRAKFATRAQAASSVETVGAANGAEGSGEDQFQELALQSERAKRASDAALERLETARKSARNHPYS